MNPGARFAWLLLGKAQSNAFLDAVCPRLSSEPFVRIAARTQAFPELLSLLDQRAAAGAEGELRSEP